MGSATVCPRRTVTQAEMKEYAELLEPAAQLERALGVSVTVSSKQKKTKKQTTSKSKAESSWVTVLSC